MWESESCLESNFPTWHFK